ncbi:chloride intracellular channel Clic-like [Watersipora subatra]|uniref:chloride intracellular channel Clic-like n=1 Tax=Watersipora subatra TaxID=2589382 RepID=UPI00355C1E20
MAEEASESTLPLVELFVKASSIDKERKGSCPMCQQWFMAFYVLSEQGYCDLLVTTIVSENPPKYFVELGTSRRLPDVRVVKGQLNGVDVSNLVCDTNDEIEEFMRKFGCEDLLTWKESKEEQAAEDVFADLYRDFNGLLQTGNTGAVNKSLASLEAYLQKQGTKFTLKDTPTYADCQLLPKLQHLRVAANFYRGFEISPSFTHIWRYLRNSYDTEVFQKSVPCDQDIIKHYEMKVPGVKVTTNRNPNLMKETMTLDIPSEVLAAIGDE